MPQLVQDVLRLRAHGLAPAAIGLVAMLNGLDLHAKAELRHQVGEFLRMIGGA
jgi:hypothetical protein